MNKRRTLKAVQKWYKGRPLTAKERNAVMRWHRQILGRLGQAAAEAAEGLIRFGRDLAAMIERNR